MNSVSQPPLFKSCYFKLILPALSSYLSRWSFMFVIIHILPSQTPPPASSAFSLSLLIGWKSRLGVCASGSGEALELIFGFIYCNCLTHMWNLPLNWPSFWLPLSHFVMIFERWISWVFISNPVHNGIIISRIISTKRPFIMPTRGQGAAGRYSFFYLLNNL